MGECERVLAQIAELELGEVASACKARRVCKEGESSAGGRRKEARGGALCDFGWSMRATGECKLRETRPDAMRGEGKRRANEGEAQRK